MGNRDARSQAEMDRPSLVPDTVAKAAPADDSGANGGAIVSNERVVRSPSELRREQPLPRHVVHKRSLEQIFVTDWMLGPGDDWCTIAAQLPLAHARFSDTAAPFHDIVLIAEVVRQAGLVVAEEWIKVPSDRQFLLRELKVTLEPIERARRTRDTCEMLVSQDPSSQVRMRPGRSMTGGMMRSRITLNGQPAGVSDVFGAWVPGNIYDGFRGSNRDAPPATKLPQPAERADVETRTGKLSPANSVITPVRSTGLHRYEASLSIDIADPTFFDHPLDHVPGLLLLEGVQQLAVAAMCDELEVDHSQVVISGFQLTFARLAEFRPDVGCSITLDDDYSGGRVSCSQGGKVCCEGKVDVAHI